MSLRFLPHKISYLSGGGGCNRFHIKLVFIIVKIYVTLILTRMFFQNNSQLLQLKHNHHFLLYNNKGVVDLPCSLDLRPIMKLVE